MLSKKIILSIALILTPYTALSMEGDEQPMDIDDEQGSSTSTAHSESKKRKYEEDESEEESMTDDEEQKRVFTEKQEYLYHLIEQLLTKETTDANDNHKPLEGTHNGYANLRQKFQEILNAGGWPERIGLGDDAESLVHKIITNCVECNLDMIPRLQFLFDVGVDSNELDDQNTMPLMLLLCTDLSNYHPQYFPIDYPIGALFTQTTSDPVFNSKKQEIRLARINDLLAWFLDQGADLSRISVVQPGFTQSSLVHMVHDLMRPEEDQEENQEAETRAFAVYWLLTNGAQLGDEVAPRTVRRLNLLYNDPITLDILANKQREAINTIAKKIENFKNQELTKQPPVLDQYLLLAAVQNRESVVSYLVGDAIKFLTQDAIQKTIVAVASTKNTSIAKQLIDILDVRHMGYLVTINRAILRSAVQSQVEMLKIILAPFQNNTAVLDPVTFKLAFVRAARRGNTEVVMILQNILKKEGFCSREQFAKTVQHAIFFAAIRKHKDTVAILLQMDLELDTFIDFSISIQRLQQLIKKSESDDAKQAYKTIIQLLRSQSMLRQVFQGANVLSRFPGEVSNVVMPRIKALVARNHLAHFTTQEH